MKVLVTGACGFIGSHMVEVAAEAGHDVIAADLPAALSAAENDRTRFPGVCSSVGAKLVPLDVTDRESVVQATRDVEVAIHIAAVFDYLAAESVLRAVNVEGTRNLMEALVAHGSCRRVVNFGAGGIYGFPDRNGTPFTEDSPKRPPNPYLVSKWDQERLAHAYRARGIEVTSLRPTSPYGPRAAYGSGQLLIGLAERPRPVAFRNLTGNIPFMHVRDLCRAALYLADYEDADGQAYNATDDGRVDAIALARIVGDEVGTRPLVLPPAPLGVVRKGLLGASRVSMRVARRTGKRPMLEYDQMQYFGRNYRYSNEKLKKTGFRFTWPEPEPGLRETLRWYLRNGWITRPSTSAAGRRGR